MIERIAQRIGMEPDYLPGYGANTARSVWTDNGVFACDYADLPTYLATGDRPLRWLHAWIAEGGTDPQKVGRFVEISVYASGVRLIVYYIGPHNGKRFEGDTLAAAILALAERLEAERE